jgi:hypothetical protein
MNLADADERHIPAPERDRPVHARLLTARGEVEERVTGLDAGAVDCRPGDPVPIFTLRKVGYRLGSSS